MSFALFSVQIGWSKPLERLRFARSRRWNVKQDWMRLVGHAYAASGTWFQFSPSRDRPACFLPFGSISTYSCDSLSQTFAAPSADAWAAGAPCPHFLRLKYREG